MKYILMVGIILTLAACKEERSTILSKSGRDFHIECLDGVQYWYRNVRSSGYMSVCIDPETLTYARCE